MQPQPHHPYHAPPPPQRRTNQMAIAAVIAGVIGWTAFPFVASIAAIVCGHMARSQIRQSGEEGDGLAILGMVLGYLHIALSCFAVAIIVAIYGGFAAFFVANGMQ